MSFRSLLPLAWLVAVPVVIAGQQPPPKAHFYAFFKARGTVVASFGGKVVTGEPFTATAVSETVQTLADGNVIDRTTTDEIARDSQGRTRRAVHFGGTDAAPEAIFLDDPVAGVQYIVMPRDKTYRRIRFHRKPGARVDRFYWFRGGAPAGPPPIVKINPYPTATESLGEQEMEGVMAKGTRTVTTIPAAAIGNRQPIVVTDEQWYSPELQEVVRSKHSDPRFGVTTYMLTNLQLAEPAADRFQPPSGFTLRDARGAKPPGNADREY